MVKKRKHRSKKKIGIFLVVSLVLLVGAIFFSSYFLKEKQKAEVYVDLVEEGIIEQGEDIDVEEYIETNEIVSTSGGSSGGGGGGSGGGGSSGGGGGEIEPEIGTELIAFQGNWITENNEGNIGGEDEIQI